MKINKYIEIVGASESRLNAMSKNSRLHISTALSKKYSTVKISSISTLQDLQDLVDRKPDLVILGMKVLLLNPEMGYDDSPKLWLSDFLAENGISFTGSETNALRLEYNKPEAKNHILAAGLQSAVYFVSSLKKPTYNHNLEFPLFIKPANRGSSKGIDENSVVYNQSDLEAKIASIHTTLNSDALLEEYLPGREFSVAIIENPAANLPIAMPVEIVSPKDNNGNYFLSTAIKKADLEKVTAITDAPLKKQVSDFAIRVFKTLGARDYGRIDIRLDAQGNPHFIEANLMPGLSNHGYLSRCFALNQQVDYDDMVLSIVELALKRAAFGGGSKEDDCGLECLPTPKSASTVSSGVR